MLRLLNYTNFNISARSYLTLMNKPVPDTKALQFSQLLDATRDLHTVAAHYRAIERKGSYGAQYATAILVHLDKALEICKLEPGMTTSNNVWIFED